MTQVEEIRPKQRRRSAVRRSFMRWQGAISLPKGRRHFFAKNAIILGFAGIDVQRFAYDWENLCDARSGIFQGFESASARLFEAILAAWDDD
jgi:hypothetical protein